ncbi:hypothetical protein M413DRAFT_434939 [Hebeloma cylindrosporum]|uniref:Uncharacterized protein n=1 Tax=Hebeloma cylindrosporum TaxID=76867 RepID=A0A0C2XA20_HEBCY|nr:hypothetical protein M413DRAFT_434939 [Hebeloma cylindrosporum h7]
MVVSTYPVLAPKRSSVLWPTRFNSLVPACNSTEGFSRRSLTFIPRHVIRIEYAACIASGFHWADWIQLLGARDFDLIIEPHVVKVAYAGAIPRVVTIWSEATSPPALLSRLNFQEQQVPISKLGQQSLMQTSLRATVNSALARAQTRTLAQQLLESDHKEEADEIFAMISKSVMSPTPTREQFPQSFMPSMTSFPSALSSPESVSSPDSSRPSSRSSTFSTFSFSDDDESVTSASSISSFDFLDSTKPSITITKPVNTFNKNAPAFAPRAPRVFIDNTKKDVTKYLYQGGISTVLTGGVMLGGGATNGAKAAKSKAAEVPKYRAPVGGKKFTAATQNATSWRRNNAPRA